MNITSPHNEKLKAIRKLNGGRRSRDAERQFVAEGEDLLHAADAAGWDAIERFCAAGSGLPGIEVEPSLLAGASALGSGTRALAIYEQRWAPQPIGPVCVYLHGVGDPGNVGTVLRSAQAFGASSVVIGRGTADPFGPKAVRASMGAIFEVPVVHTRSLPELPGVTIALVPGAGVPLHELWQQNFAERSSGGKVQPLSLLIGAERDGLPEEIVEQADRKAHIPIANHSLNAAMAATVALYEVTRMARAT